MSGRTIDLLLLLLSLIIIRFLIFPAYEGYKTAKENLEKIKQEKESISQKKSMIESLSSDVRELTRTLKNIKRFEISQFQINVLRKEKVSSELKCPKKIFSEDAENGSEFIPSQNCFSEEVINLSFESPFQELLFLISEMSKIEFSASPLEMRITRRADKSDNLVLEGNFKMLYYER
jgi:hypothetical protein